MFKVARISLGAGIVLAALLYASGTASAAPASVGLGFAITMEGMTQDTGSDIASAVVPADTNIVVTDARPLKPGMYLHLQSGSSWEALAVVAAAGDGPCAFPNGCAINDNVTVVRAQRGTVAASYTVGAAVFATFVRVPIDVTGISWFDTGADLALDLDMQTLDQTGALLVEGINSSVTQIKVSDARLIPYPSQIKIDNETMTVVIASFGLNTNSGVTLEEDVLFNSKTTLKISNKNLLQVGWRLRIPAYYDAGGTDPGPPEEMLIVGLAGDGPGGAQDTMTVVRGTTILNLINGSSIFAGQDKLTVVRGASPASHSAAAPVSVSFKIAAVTDESLITPGSNVMIDSEVMQVREIPSKHFHTSGATLTTGPNGSTTLLRVSDADLVDDGDIIRLDSEQLAVQRTDAGCSVQPGAKIIAAMDAVQTDIAVNDPQLLEVGCTVKIGTEEMRVDALTPADPPSEPDAIMTVARGYNDTVAATHPVNAAIQTAQDSVRVTRGMYTTGAATHSSGIAVHELTTEANTAKMKRAGTLANHGLGASIIDVDGLGGYSLALSAEAPTTAAEIDAPIGGEQTTIPITNGTSIQPGWIVVADNEKMKVTGVTATTMTVMRGVHGTIAIQHAPATAIRGPVIVEFSYGRDGTLLTSTSRTADCSGSPPVLPVEGVSFGCSSTGTPLGAVGGGTLAYIEVWGQQLLTNTPPATLTITPALSDLSGDGLPVQSVPLSQIKVIKCGDVNGNGVITNADATLIQQGVFGLGPSVPATMDVNLNGVVTNADATLVRQVLFLAEPVASPKRCLPAGP